MKWNLAAAIFTIFIIEMYEPPPAEACGVKLTVKSSAPRRSIARTSNPSDVLLLGSPPRRLERDLSAAGHRVEVAPNASAAKRKSYAVVIVESKQADEARSNFRDSVIVVRSGDAVADVRSVEKQVSRQPVRTDESRTVVAARTDRTPVATGPDQRKVVTTSEPTVAPEPVAPPPPPAPPVAEPKPVEAAATATVAPEPKPKTVEPKPAQVKPTPAATTITGGAEVFFSTGSADTSSTGGLDKAVRWLKGSPDVHVIIEGHADPTGSADDNMVLSQRRAEWVRDYLVTAGIDQSRLEVASFGDTRLKYGQTDRRNRRVAIVAK